MLMKGKDWTPERVKVENEAMHDKETYRILNDFAVVGKKNKAKITYECLKCGTITSVNVHHFFAKMVRCSICNRGLKYTNERLNEFMKKYPDTEIIANVEITNQKIRVTLKHNCGHIWTTTCGDIINYGPRCENCGRGERYTPEKVKRDYARMRNKNLKLLDCSNVVNSKSKVTAQCLVCLGIWKPQVSDFVNEVYGCPNCNKSKGEILVRQILTNLHLSFQTQIKFDDLRLKNQLSYDFGILSMKFLIEVQGRQHREFVIRFHQTIKGFYLQLHRDRIKRKWAEDNGYTLLEIWFDELDKTEDIIIKTISKLQTT